MQNTPLGLLYEHQGATVLLLYEHCRIPEIHLPLRIYILPATTLHQPPTSAKQYYTATFVSVRPHCSTELLAAYYNIDL